MLLNLFDNACWAVQQKQKQMQVLAGENGEEQACVPTVKVGTHRQEGQVEIRTQDNGTGIPELVKAKLFQPFFQRSCS